MPSTDIEAQFPPPASAAAEDTPLVTNDNNNNNSFSDGGDIESGLGSATTTTATATASSLEPEQLKPIKDGSIKETLVGIFAAITFLACAIAMIISHGIFVIVTGLFGLFLSPFSAFQQQKITQAVAMKETNEFFEKQLSILRRSNLTLSQQVSDMTQSITNLKDMERTLERVQLARGNCLQELEKQLQQQREIAAMTASNVKNDIIGNLMEIALNVDDGDNVLSDAEIEVLMTKIEAISGVDIREDKVRQLLNSHNGEKSIFSLMEVAKNFLRHDIPDDQKLFVYK